MAKDSIHDLLKKFAGVPERLEKNLSMAVRMAAQEAASEAKRNHGYTDRSSVLTNSIGPDGPHGSFRANNLHAIVSAGASYGVFIEKGTKPHVIKPKHRKALRWTGPAGFIFSRKGVKHPGTKPYRFLENSVKETMPKLRGDLIPDAIELSFVQAGFRRGQ